jgi:mono/diheme cytochrome c family protein
MSKKRTKSTQASAATTKPPAATPPGKAAGAKVRRSGRGCSIAVVGLLLIIVIGMIISMPWLITLLRNGTDATVPLSAGAAHELLVEHQSQAAAQLNSYGWVDQAAGIARVPIDRAITLLAASELPVGAAAQGAAVPPGSSGDLTNVNFTDHILPIFQDRCAECHGDDDPEEGLVLTSYRDVMLGSFYGAVVKPGDPAGSYLVELVETGQMPKRDGDLTPEQIALIIAWVEAGAPEFGSAESEATADGESTTGTSITPETVSFATDILPVFEERCAECHGDDDPEEGLVLTSYRDVMLGSFYGAVVKPGEPADSYLVESVETGQMPKRGDDLTPEQIAAIVAWVEAGAPDN